MKDRITGTAIFTFILGFISLAWILYDIYKVITDLPGVLNIHASGYLLAIGYIPILLFHGFALLFLFMHLRRFDRPKILRIVLLLLGVLSLFFIAVEKVMFDEIAREMQLEFPLPNETMFLYLGFGINALFTILALIFVMQTILHQHEKDSPAFGLDDRIFRLAQVMGIISGSMGIFLTLANITREIPPHLFWISIPFYLLFLLPYLLIVFFWISLRLKTKVRKWYDEKQWSDIRNAAGISLLLSFPGFGILFCLPQPLHFYWLPYYFFFILLVFSASTLYFFIRQ